MEWGSRFFTNCQTELLKTRESFPPCTKNGFLQFGLPHEGNYDPVCFDMKRRKRADAPIVQLDHEEILQWSRIRVVKEIAPSFAQFMQRAMTERFPLA